MRDAKKKNDAWHGTRANSNDDNKTNYNFDDDENFKENAAFENAVST